MSDESTGESEEMDRDLKEYLACFKTNEGKQPKPKGTSPAKGKVHRKYEKVVEDPSSQKLNSSTENSLSEDSSLFSTSAPHKRFNLQDISDLQASHMMSESDVTPSSANKDDDNSVSAIGKLVLSLKELGSTPEDTALGNNSDNDDATTSSFNINANIFTVDDLVAADDVESTTSKSTAAADDDDDDNDKVTDNKSTESEVKSYKDDFEEENTFVEESFVSESIKEDVSSSNTTEIRPSKSDGSVELTGTAVSSSPSVDEDSNISQRTEETQTFQNSSTSQSTTESSLSKREVAIQTDPSWKMAGAANNAFLLDDLVQRSEGETMALHNLVIQQLHLTRSLIDTARSLHHSQTLAIRPDYHYITLEDTKKFIETHKPKMIKMKK